MESFSLTNPYKIKHQYEHIGPINIPESKLKLPLYHYHFDSEGCLAYVMFNIIKIVKGKWLEKSSIDTLQNNLKKSTPRANANTMRRASYILKTHDIIMERVSNEKRNIRFLRSQTSGTYAAVVTTHRVRLLLFL